MSTAIPQEKPQPVRFWSAFAYWLRLGFISFGGPAGQIAIMHRELVEQRRWISERRFLHALNYCMLLPGPEAQQLATYIGWLMHGVKGGIVAGALFVLPSLFILIALSWAYMAAGAEVTSNLLYGIKPAVVAVVIFAAYRIGTRVLKRPLAWGLAAAAFVAALLRLPFPMIVLCAAALGWLLRQRLSVAAHGGGKQIDTGLALIDDHTPTPERLRYAPARLAAVVLAGLGLWALPLMALRSMQPFESLALFFSKAALVTFGGAYAVMPYVFQNAAETFHWITPAQMMDGLALGETTPGPLIMVVAFIGFVSAWGQGAGAAALAALVATWFTFLPSFVFILAGAPLVESTREDFKLGGPLTAITAAVVGAILYLAVYFAAHVFWPAGRGAAPDIAAMALTVLALLALQRNWLGMIPVILLCGLLGAGWKLSGVT